MSLQIAIFSLFFRQNFNSTVQKHRAAESADKTRLGRVIAKQALNTAGERVNRTF